jgi:hypothetical protein
VAHPGRGLALHEQHAQQLVAHSGAPGVPRGGAGEALPLAVPGRHPGELGEGGHGEDGAWGGPRQLQQARQREGATRGGATRGGATQGGLERLQEAALHNREQSHVHYIQARILPKALLTRAVDGPSDGPN